MKKALYLILLFSLFLVSACTDAKTQSLQAFYRDAEIETVDTIIIQDGSTGASKTITAQEQIDELLLLMNDITFSPQSNQEERVGWRYRIRLFDGEKEFDFTLSQIGHTYYDSTPDIYPIIDDYYQQLDIEEP